MEDSLKREIWDQSKEWIDGIGVVVDELAAQMGIAAEHVYRVYTKQMFVEGIVSVIMGITLIILVSLFYRWLLKKIFAKDEYGNYVWDDMAITMVSFFSTAGFIIFFILTILDVRSGAFMMFNPEYYTMRDLLKTVQGMIK